MQIAALGVVTWFLIELKPYIPTWFDEEYWNDLYSASLYIILFYILMTLTFFYIWILLLYEIIICINYYFYDRNTLLKIDPTGKIEVTRNREKVLFEPSDIQYITLISCKQKIYSTSYYCIRLNSRKNIIISSLIAPCLFWNNYINTYNIKFQVSIRWNPFLS